MPCPAETLSLPSFRGSCGLCPSFQILHGQPGEEWGTGSGIPSVGAAQGLGAICNEIKFVASYQGPASVFLWVQVTSDLWVAGDAHFQSHGPGSVGSHCGLVPVLSRVAQRGGLLSK
jgi:hypothetical protein